MVVIKASEQIFQQANSNVNKAVFGNIVYNPRAFGAKADGVTDDSAAINATIASAVSAGYESVIWFPAGKYLIKSPIVVKHGGVDHNINIMGYGARLLAGTPGMDMIQVVPFGAPASYLNIGLTRILGLRMYGSGDSGSVGIRIGKVTGTYGIDGTFPSLVKDVTIENVQNGIVFMDSRLWQFDNVHVSTSVPSSNGILIQSTTDTFCGDCWVRDCNFVMPFTSGNGIILTATTVTTKSSIAGIHIRDCVMYGQNGVKIYITNAPSTINDVWITSCAFDGNANGNAIDIQGLATGGLVDQIMITDAWINSYNGGIYLNYANAVTIKGGKISSIQNQAIDLERTNDCIVHAVKFNDVNKLGNGGGFVKLGPSGNRNMVKDCRFYNTGGTYTFQTIYIDSTQVKPIVSGNIKDAGTGLITNNVAGTEGTNFIIAGNL